MNAVTIAQEAGKLPYNNRINQHCCL